MESQINKHDKFRITNELRGNLMKYFRRGIPTEETLHELFDYVSDNKLKQQLVNELYSTRIMYRIMSGLSLNGLKRQGFIRFQIIQYTAIYEAVIGYLLFDINKDKKIVSDLLLGHEFKPANEAVSIDLSMSFKGESLLLCRKKQVKKQLSVVKFDDKVNACKQLKLITDDFAQYLKTLYALRNSVHLEKKAKEDISYELQQAGEAYNKLWPFAVMIRSSLHV